MRLIFFLLVTLIVTSCGHQKIRFSKVNQKQKVVEISDIPSLKKKTESTLASNIEQEEIQPEIESNTLTVSTSDESLEDSRLAPYESEILLPQTVEDSTSITAQEAEAITQEALLSQKKGAWSLGTSIASPILFVAGVILFAFSVFGGLGPVGAILSIVLLISSVVGIVLSYVFGVSSLRSQYNTPRGRKFAIAGIVTISVFLFLFLLNIGFGLL